MATSTALKAFMQAPRDQRVTALRSLGAEKMVQLEGELREARLTLFGPLPVSKSGTAPHAAPPPSCTVPPPKQCPANIPPPPKEEPVPAPPKDPPTPRGPPPRDGTPHRERPASRGPAGPAPHRPEARGSADPAPHRREAQGSDDPAPQRQKPGHWTNKQGKGKGRLWADLSDADEWDDIPASDAAPSSAPPAQHPAPHPAPHQAQHPAQQPAPQPGNLDVGWAAFYAYEKGLAKGKAQQAQHWAPPSPFPGATPQGWAYPPPAPPRDPSPHRPATLRASRHVHSEVRWIKARDGSRRPVFQSHTGKICCAIECGSQNCPFDRLPCNKPLHSPPSEDVHILHRCSKCKERED